MMNYSANYTNGARKPAKKYPFPYEKCAHDFLLVANRAFNLMCDMESGVIPMNEKAYDKLEEMKRVADDLLVGYYGKVVWVDGKTYATMKKFSDMARTWRTEVCAKYGIPYVG